ncbi:MAG: alpha/beta hydrolase [Hydrococcus sp. C42_A2020_068]|nr:alpha/beta hydrolase [Hydrococcus sp. C42_A2020_068]
MPIIDILGVPHAYELTPLSSNSDNPVLVFIHGWLLSRNYWKPLVEGLSPDYQCLTYDLRGFGDSQPAAVEAHQKSCSNPQWSKLGEGDSKSYSCYSLAAYAQDLSILLEKLAIKKAWLIGHSLGGSIALWAADLCPEIVKGAICLNSGGGIYIKEEFERFRTAGQQLIQLRPRWLSSLPLIDLLFARMMVARPLARHWGRQRVIDFVRADEEAAIGSLLDTTTEAEVHLLPQLVSRLQQPVYFLAGNKDNVMEPKYVRHLASFHQLFTANGGNVIEIPNCGHLSMIEQPEIVGAKIVKILIEHSSK